MPGVGWGSCIQLLCVECRHGCRNILLPDFKTMEDTEFHKESLFFSVPIIIVPYEIFSYFFEKKISSPFGSGSSGLGPIYSIMLSAQSSFSAFAIS